MTSFVFHRKIEKKKAMFWLIIFLVNYPFKRNVNTCLCLTHNATDISVQLYIWITMVFCIANTVCSEYDPEIQSFSSK